MNHITLKQATELYAILKEAPRIRILNLILHYDWVAGPDLQSVFKYEQQYIHRHITLMKRYNLLNVMKKGVTAFYSIKPEFKMLIYYHIMAIKDEQLEMDLESYKAQSNNYTMESKSI